MEFFNIGSLLKVIAVVVKGVSKRSHFLGTVLSYYFESLNEMLLHNFRVPSMLFSQVMTFQLLFRKPFVLEDAAVHAHSLPEPWLAPGRFTTQTGFLQNIIACFYPGSDNQYL